MAGFNITEVIEKIVENKFQINNVNIETFKHNHGSIDVQTYRIGNFAYSTDLKKFYEKDIDRLKNLDLWIVGLLRPDPHPSHGGFDDIMHYVNYLKPKKTILTNLKHELDYYHLLRILPSDVVTAYDGLKINL